jgi:DNA-binding NarL/FixJ family response regulator
MTRGHPAEDVVPTKNPEGHADLEGRARVLIADDHRPMLDRIVALVAGEFSVVGAVMDGDELVEAAADLHPDVIVLDISMPRLNGLEAAARIAAKGAPPRIVCLTAHEEPDFMRAAWDAGALAYVTKTRLAADLQRAIRAALKGQRFVSPSMTPEIHRRVAPQL